MGYVNRSVEASHTVSEGQKVSLKVDIAESARWGHLVSDQSGDYSSLFSKFPQISPIQGRFTVSYHSVVLMVRNLATLHAFSGSPNGNEWKRLATADKTIREARLERMGTAVESRGTASTPP